MTLAEYFARTDTPAAESPCGRTMTKIVEKFPGIAFDDARAKAHELLSQAARAKHYVGPRVFSDDEMAARRAQLSQAFNRPAPESPTPVYGKLFNAI